jgi:hypothetical protein
VEECRAGLIDPKVLSAAPGSAAGVFSAVLVKGARPVATPDEYLENLLHYVSTRLGFLDKELEQLQRRLDGLQNNLDKGLDRLQRRLDGLQNNVYERLAALEQRQAAAGPPPAPLPPGAEPIP